MVVLVNICFATKLSDRFQQKMLVNEKQQLTSKNKQLKDLLVL